MNPIYQQLIDREQAKVSLLHLKIARHEERIATLKELAMEDDEETSLQTDARGHSPASPTPAVVGRSDQSEEQRYPSRISDANFRLLQYIGTNVRSLNELEAFCAESDLGMKRKDITSFANVYRKRFGMLDSPAVSHYQLTERGKQFVSERLQNVTQIEQPESTSLADPTVSNDHHDLA